MVTDETAKVLHSRRCHNELSKRLALLAPYRDELTGGVVDPSNNGYWLVDGLMAAGYAVKLANTVAMKPIRQPSCAIWLESAPSWCVAAPRICWRCRSLHAA